MKRLAIVALLFGLCANYVTNARAHGALALPSYVVAPYQVCILTDFPIFYNEIEKVHRPRRLGLAGAAEVLKQLGFRTTTEHVAYKALLNDKRLHLIQDKQGHLLVIEHGGRHLLAFDYPLDPIEFGRSMVNNWPTPAISIDRVPTRKLGRSPLVVTPQLHDFGAVDAGDPVTTTFDLWNATSQKVTLLSMQTSCGCTVMDGKLGSLMPNGHRQFTVKFNSTGKWGYDDWTCVIETNKGPAIFILSGYVQPATDYFPHQVAFGDIVLGQRKCASIRFLGRDHDHNSPIVVVSASKGLKTTITRSIDPYWHVGAYSLNITIAPDGTMLGKYAGALHFKYKAAGELRDATIPVSAFICDVPTRCELHVIRNVVPNAREGTPVKLDTNVSYDLIKDFRVDCPGKGISVLKRSADDGKLVLDLFCRNKVDSAVAEATITFAEHNHAKRLVVVLVISSR